MTVGLLVFVWLVVSQYAASRAFTTPPSSSLFVVQYNNNNNHHYHHRMDRTTKKTTQPFTTLPMIIAASPSLYEQQQQQQQQKRYPWPIMITNNNTNTSRTAASLVSSSSSSSSSSTTEVEAEVEVEVAQAAGENMLFFRDQSFYAYNTTQPIHSDVWKRLCPSAPSKKKKNPFRAVLSAFSWRPHAQQDDEQQQHLALDYTKEWDPYREDPYDIAQEIIDDCFVKIRKLPTISMDEDEDDVNISSLVTSLTESLQVYRDFCYHSQLLPSRERAAELASSSSTTTLASLSSSSSSSSSSPLPQPHHHEQHFEDNTDTCGDTDCDCGDGGGGGGGSSRSNTTEHDTDPTPIIRMKSRVVATRGMMNPRCPQYHIDQLPCRWVQTMVGPGVDIVQESNQKSRANTNTTCINWDLFFNIMEEDTYANDVTDSMDDEGLSHDYTDADRNRLLVNTDKATIYHAQEGEGIIMAGSKWNAYYNNTSSIHKNANTKTKPVVHKSPELVTEDQQYRVLFTQEILLD